jgi:competence protein ComEC
MRAALESAVPLAEMFDREPDPWTALSLAAMSFLVISPDLLFDIGFQLSFLCVASLLLFTKPIAARLSLLPYALRECLAATIAAQILPLPLVLHLFHVLPLLSPLANLIVVPFSPWCCGCCYSP